MTVIRPAWSGPPSPRRWRYRLAIPAVAALLFAALAALWHWGPRTLYFAVLGRFGFVPFRFPFLDIHAVLAAAQCQRLGFDVYRYNPCDVLGRVHVYSPLWLTLTPHVLGTGATTPVGLGLDLMFILALASVIRPTSPGETLLCGLAALSPMTIYALERANCDVLIFLLIVAGCALGRASRPWRFGAYGFYLFAGLLKYYPLVLLVLLVRERRRDALILAALATGSLLALAGIAQADLVKALGNIPVLSYFADSFSARNLPFGIAEITFGTGRHGAALLLLLVLGALAATRISRTVRLLDRAALDPEPFAAQTMLVGALVLTACFFSGQNIDYRGIYFVLIMPGLVRLRGLEEDPKVRRFLAQMMAAVLLVAWADPMRSIVDRFATQLGGALGPRIELLFWIGRELLWWWLIAGLAAIILAYAARALLRPGCRWPRLDIAVPAAIRRAKRGA